MSSQRTRRAGAIVLAAVLASPFAGAQPAPTVPTAAERAAIDTCLAGMPVMVQVAVALVRGDEVRFLGAERTEAAVRLLDNRSAVFQIGSITKVFTATLLAQRVAAGALRLEDPVASRLPFKLKAPGRGGVEGREGGSANADVPASSGQTQPPSCRGGSANYPVRGTRRGTRQSTVVGGSLIAGEEPAPHSPGLCYPWSVLSQTPSQLLVDQQGRPYFLWDCEMTLDELKEALVVGTPEVRAYLVGKLMRQAKPDDVLSLVSIETIRGLWPDLERYLGTSRELWTWLLDRWEALHLDTR